jgi:mRNA interferase RelE/StbE
VLKLDLYPASHAFLQTLPPKQFCQVALQMFALLGTPQPHDYRPVHGTPYWRVDVADDILEVPLIGKRNDDEVYRRLKRRER